jgi:hypothetical protein
MKVTWNNKFFKICLIYKETVLVDTQNSQSIKTFLSHGVSEVGVYSF